MKTIFVWCAFVVTVTCKTQRNDFVYTSPTANETVTEIHVPTSQEYKGIANSYDNTKSTVANADNNIRMLIEKVMALAEYKVYRFINRNFIFITSVPGLITNPLIVYLALIMKPRTTSEFHMLVLGVTDFCVVSFRLTTKLMTKLSLTWTNLTCRCFYYSVNLAYLYSDWILVN